MMTAELFASNARGRRASRASINLGGGGVGGGDIDDTARRRRASLVVDGLSIVNVIRKKRDGEELADHEIDWFVSSATKRLITDAQIGMRHCKKSPHVDGYFAPSFPYFNVTGSVYGCDVCALWSQIAMDPGYLCMFG